MLINLRGLFIAAHSHVQNGVYIYENIIVAKAREKNRVQCVLVLEPAPLVEVAFATALALLLEPVCWGRVEIVIVWPPTTMPFGPSLTTTPSIVVAGPPWCRVVPSTTMSPFWSSTR